MGEIFKPSDPGQVVEAIAWAVAEGKTLAVRGHGSKAGLGRPVAADFALDLSALAGISLYEPEELVMTAAAGTPLAEIEAVLTQHGQQLAFEPGHWGPLYGGAGQAGSIGGVFACNLSGPRRPRAGAARDHLLGVKAVSGRGEAFKAGGRVVKNVTGYDLCKLLAGSHGTLAALTEMTFKVLPAAEKVRTLLLIGLTDDEAVRVMGAVAGSPHEISAAAHLPAAVAGRSGVDRVSQAGAAVTAIRIEGPGPSVIHRCAALAREHGGGGVEELHSHNSSAFWREIRDVAPLAPADATLWRLSVPPAAAARAATIVRGNAVAEVWYDWGGGLVWVAPEQGTVEAAVRSATAAVGGHATLIRAPDAARLNAAVFQPQAAPVAALSARIKDVFDPHHCLNPGRMYAGV